MLAGMAEVASERGAGNVTVAHVVARSGVSRRTFYEIFADREDCFLAAFDDAVERLAARVLPAYATPGRWRERMRAALAALLDFLDEEPGAGRLCVVETLAAGPAALERRAAVLGVVKRAVDEGRREAKGEGAPPLTAEGVVGAVLSVIHARLTENAPGSFSALLNPLMAMIVLPYMGAAAATRELERPRPKARKRVARAASDPLRDLDMRLTYRTVRVLLAIAQTPGASNRRLADASDVRDQGQISKLLGRLSALGLIENTGLGPARGEPNAWRLTAKGQEVSGAIQVQTAG
jgi:AcrR family transcriptional regulator